MKVNLGPARKVRIEMLPLIDIVFLLLVFFIYAMLSMAVHRGLPVVLPLSETADETLKKSISVTLTADGAVFVEENRVSQGSLREELKKYIPSGSDAGVLLFADREVSYEQMFGVMDEIKMAGINKICLQAEVGRAP